MRRPRIRTRTLAGTAAILAATASVGVWTLTRAGASAQATPLVMTVSRGTVRQTVSTTGTITPAHQADAAFTVSGTVTSVPASVGEKVSRGQTLATLDDRQLATAVDLARAKVTAAQDAVTAAASGSASQQAAAQAQLASARNALSQAQSALDAATLTSPIAGTVASVGIAVGDNVGSGASASTARGSGSAASTTANGSSTETITVISTTSWVVDGSVGAADLPSLKKGLQAEIVPDGTSTKVFGTVSTIGIMATSSSSGTATFPITIAVTGAPKGLYAGTSASVSIIVKQASNVLTVPTAALSSQGGSTYVMRWVGGKEVRTPVTVGTVYGSSTQVTSGLSDGDQVALTRARPGGAGSSGGSGGRQGDTSRFPGGFRGGGGFGGGFVTRGGAGG